MPESASRAVLPTSGPRWSFLALSLLVILGASNADGAISSRHGFSIYPVALGLATAAVAWGVATRRTTLRLPTAALLFGVVLATEVPAVLAARDQAVAFGALVELAKSMWFLVVVALLAATVASAWTIARLVTGSMTALAGLSLVNELLLGNASDFGGLAVVSTSTGVGAVTARHAGPFEDPNFWGRLLILAVPLAVALAVDAWQRRVRATATGWAACVLVLSGGLYLTQSRGSLLGLAVAAVLCLAVAGPRPRRSLLLAPVVVVLLASLPGVGSRIATLGELDQLSGASDYSLVERTAAQQIALAIFVDNPAFGVGPLNIPVVWDDYTEAADITVRRQVAPHNLYVQLGAESGVLGLVGWLVFVLGILTLAARVVLASPALPRGGIPRDRLLAAAALSGLAGWSVASIFLHLSYLRPLLLVVAIIAVLDLQLPMTRRVAAIADAPGPRRRSTARRVAVGGLALCLIAGVTWYASTRRQDWVARVPVTLAPQLGPGGTATAYQYDLLTRPTVAPTYARLVETAGGPLVAERVSAAGLDPARVTLSVVDVIDESTVMVEVRGPEPDLVTDLAEQVAERGADYARDNASVAAFATLSVGATSTYTATRWLP